MNSSFLRRSLSATSINCASIKIGMIPADGIGREVIPAAQLIMEHVSSTSTFTFQYLDSGFELFQRTGTALPAATIQELTTCQGALFGEFPLPQSKGILFSYRAIEKSTGSLRKRKTREEPFLRRDWNRYAYCARKYGMSGILYLLSQVIIKYIKSERMEVMEDGSKIAWADRKISSLASTRIAKMAFELAMKRDAMNGNGALPLVTCVHKSNVLSITDGLFRECVLQVSKAYKGNVRLEEQLVDSMVYRMFREPGRFDVAVAPNLYGDIISDAAAALVGSLGVVAGANVGENFVMGEPVHGSAPDIAGKGIANPIAAIRSAALLLEYMEMTAEAKRIYDAVDKVLCNGQVLTPDLGGKSTTMQVTESVIEYL